MPVYSAIVLAELLQQYSQGAWLESLDTLTPDIHTVDRDATRIWFHFFPLALRDALATTDNRAELVRRYRLAGSVSLTSQIDSSHWFMYGHRYWSAVKAQIQRGLGSVIRVEDGPAAIARALAEPVAAAAAVDRSLLLGVTFVGLMTLRQVGTDAFGQQPVAHASPGDWNRSPEDIMAARRKNDSQGVFGFLRGSKTRYSVCFDERRRDARFQLINQQDLTMAAAADTRDYLSGPRPSREGPIPTDCRSASCGTCWVGVLGGASKLSDVDDLERRRLREFGYITTEAARPIIRLACMARASGNVTIVIPSWNGIIGRLL